MEYGKKNEVAKEGNTKRKKTVAERVKVDSKASAVENIRCKELSCSFKIVSRD